MEHSKTGEWCFQDGNACDNHISNSPFPLVNGEQCVNRFCGLCDKGDRFLPVSKVTDPKDRQVTVKQYTPNEFFMDYSPLIGKTFDIASEFSDSVLIRIGERLIAIWIYDCVITMRRKPKRRIARVISSSINKKGIKEQYGYIHLGKD